MRLAYPYLKNVWEMRPTVAPYDTKHLVLLNVVPNLWKPFEGLKLVKKDGDEAYIMPKATVTLVGRELRSARRTVPRAQTRSFRNIDVHHKSVKAVDWMHFILCTGEILLAGRIPGDFYDSLMALSRASGLLLRPRGVSEAEINFIDNDLKCFVGN